MSKRYNEEFMKNAVNHLIISGKAIHEVASSLGVSTSALGRWKQKYECRTSALELSKDEQILRLRKELTNAEEENLILKKSVGIFLKIQR